MQRASAAPPGAAPQGTRGTLDPRWGGVSPGSQPQGCKQRRWQGGGPGGSPCPGAGRRLRTAPGSRSGCGCPRSPHTKKASSGRAGGPRRTTWARRSGRALRPAPPGRRLQGGRHGTLVARLHARKSTPRPSRCVSWWPCLLSAPPPPPQSHPSPPLHAPHPASRCSRPRRLRRDLPGLVTASAERQHQNLRRGPCLGWGHPTATPSSPQRDAHPRLPGSTQAWMQSCSLPKRLALPPQPPYQKRSQDPVSRRWYHITEKRAQALPGSFSREHGPGMPAALRPLPVPGAAMGILMEGKSEQTPPPDMLGGRGPHTQGKGGATPQPPQLNLQGIEGCSHRGWPQCRSLTAQGSPGGARWSWRRWGAAPGGTPGCWGAGCSPLRSRSNSRAVMEMLPLGIEASQAGPGDAPAPHPETSPPPLTPQSPEETQHRPLGVPHLGRVHRAQAQGMVPPRRQRLGHGCLRPLRPGSPQGEHQDTQILAWGQGGQRLPCLLVPQHRSPRPHRKEDADAAAGALRDGVPEGPRHRAAGGCCGRPGHQRETETLPELLPGARQPKGDLSQTLARG